jgi:CheY-like chemotaxis protein
MPTILIVDDDAALRDSLAETVHDLGYQARLARSGREALGVLASNEIHGVRSIFECQAGWTALRCCVVFERRKTDHLLWS